MKYIDAEKLIAEIERRREKCADIAADERNEDVAEYYRGKEVAYDETSDLITSLQQEQPSLPSNLDEAANNYGVDIRLGYPRVMDETDRYIYNAFKAGAKWMAEQGVTREVEVKEDAGGYPYIDKHFELYDYDKDEPLFKAGDKVVVQIRKK